MKDAPLTTCTCGKEGTVRRKIGTGAGLIFKGSGFYETDYRRKSSGKSDSGSSATGSGGSSSPSTPASSTPAPSAPSTSSTPSKPSSGS